MTLSFNLAPGVALGQAVEAIQAMRPQLHAPATLQGTFQGTAQAFQSSLTSTPLLVRRRFSSIYIVLGMLYESYIHPITILSALPSAGVGALLMLMLFHYDLTLIALIGIILLIGIVKKNAIMMIDFALEAERNEGKSPAGGDPRGLPAALPADHDDDDVRASSAACRSRSARAPAPNCAGRSASPSSAGCWCRSC